MVIEAPEEVVPDADTAIETPEEIIPEADTAVETPEEVVPDAETADAPAVDDGVFDTRTGELIDADTAAAAVEAAEAELEITDTGEFVDPAAGLPVAEPAAEAVEEPVDVPVVSEAEVEGLAEVLSLDPATTETAPIAAAIAAAAVADEGQTEGNDPVALDPEQSEDLVTAVTETITEADVRSSDKEFEAAPVVTSDGRKSGLSNLEKAGLVVLGALVVGSIIKSNRERREEETRVISNTGDRVVVLRPDGTYQVLKDDDTIIRRPGSTVRTETFNDGSTRTIIEQDDGTQVVTIRDASGRVLRRATYDDRGREIVLIDDLREEEVVIVRELPTPRSRIVISSKDEDIALKRELASIEADKAGRKFSLRQIREIPEVRALAAVIDTENVTFASGSSAIAAAEARDLADLGGIMQDLLEVNPGEVFLIEGHTDATGKAALNLALSDRRAESVALALTEYFDIPPENMIVQGYGESELLVDTQASEPANRRVEVRVITPLLQTAAD
ncbi:MAG: hypothetical protein B7Z10_01900 [Rhodobacterales bacterium 32-66-7]|nr:MAG: hypothetical protein B7Z31_08855 [Rhodobacterales bacterium 12-65-15]OYX26867.1 MAG: hypothetical protein B7Z10_01900 [Rhodobacterales bacterium 32-66-7]